MAQVKVNVPEKETLISLLLDESGSMTSCWDATISGFNEYLGSLKRKDKEKILFSLTKFDSDRITIVNNCTPVKDVPELNKETYKPGASTPLFDAIGKTINAVTASISKRVTKPSVLIVIMTDGEENSSKEFQNTDIKALIKEKEKEGWTFVYLGANQDAWAVGSTFGLHKGNVKTYSTADMGGTFTCLAVQTSNYVSMDSNQTTAFFSSTDTSKKKKKEEVV